MKIDQNLLYGIWEMNNITSYRNNVLTSEKHNSGMFVFTRENQLSVVSGSNEKVMSYTGDVRINEDALLIQLKACNFREREGSEIMRKILHLDAKKLILEATSEDKLYRAQISWIKKHSL